MAAVPELLQQQEEDRSKAVAARRHPQRGKHP
ncbi:SNX5 isoform 19 [Pan troglodytes]|uniref:Sorting nexin 5 n=4 Tax=Homininae TaxID=207598 RepID=U3KQL0_HUMAN|nr:sorting nexin 5 isoform 2 [Homo sapiens]PNI62657.1 SNX5 isoform 18 [Pan troglodytes]PNI62658.1 SNX5 isoform 19 [Pan troglodytes]